MQRLAAFAAAAAAVLGCASTYAPPMRTPTSGAPGRLGKSEAEIGLGLGSYTPGGGVLVAPPFLGPELAFGLADWISVEANGEWRDDRSLVGVGGVRFTPSSFLKPGNRFAMDLAVGAGAGMGGIICEDAGTLSDSELRCDGGVERDGRDWTARTVVGGYLDMGFGWIVKQRSRSRTALFLRPRVEYSTATGLPDTIWVLTTFGPHFTLLDRIEIHFSVGPSIYLLAPGVYHGDFLFELGLAVRLGGKRGREKDRDKTH